MYWCRIKSIKNVYINIKTIETLIKLTKFYSRKQKIKIKFGFLYDLMKYHVKIKRVRMGRGKGAVSGKIVKLFQAKLLCMLCYKW
jgi:hypothetical protein